MPVYTFTCNDCNDNFEMALAIKDYSPNQTCPHCSSNKVVRDYQADSSVASVVASDDNIKLGHLAARNRDRMSDDQKASIKEKHNEYRKADPGGELPSGMSRYNKEKGDWA